MSNDHWFRSRKHGPIYTIMNILSHTYNPLFFSNTLYFTIYGAMIILLNDFHENTFDPIQF